MAWARPSPQPRNMGRHLHIVHVGDSRAYLLRETRLHRLTRDHTYVQLLVDSGQLSQEEAADFGARHLLVNALGGFDEELAVDVDQLELTRWRSGAAVQRRPHGSR